MIKWASESSRKLRLPRIFGSEDVLLPIFSPAIAVIMRTFQAILRVNSHVVSPSRQYLSETQNYQTFERKEKVLGSQVTRFIDFQRVK